MAVFAEPTVIGTTLNGRFSLDKELGRGGMGAVYRATDQVLQRNVAIKLLKDRTGEEVARKIRLEAQILARLVHDSIVRIYDFGEADGLYYFVMEEVDGSNFHNRMRKLSLAERLRIMAEVAEALDYAHHQGVVHRDVKPANVLMTAGDHAKLSDFGLSLLVEQQSSETTTIRGTPSYMSPEQAKGKRLDHRTDLYSLGVMLYECATGAPPFSGPPLAVIACHATTEPDPPRSINPSLSSTLEQLILSLMMKDPARRPASGSQVAESLRQLISAEVSAGENAASLSIAERPSASGSSTFSPKSEPLRSQPTQATLIRTGVEPSIAVPLVASTSSASVLAVGGSSRAIARAMLDDVVAEPVLLSADERYLSGHYLAYLLGGARRSGLLRRRPLDRLNGDRARLLLAMTWLSTRNAGETELAAAARLLDERPEVRAMLNPVVVTKYLAHRDSPAKRKRFRQTRRLLQEASKEARESLTDSRGNLNPGLMPQTLDDLRKVAPAKTEVDDQLVNRWNRVAEGWRARPDLRESVLRYATSTAWRDPYSVELWPEMVYPLIERARRQRQLRSFPEALLDQICGALHLPDAGLRFDRAFRAHVPPQVVEKIDLSLNLLADDPILDADQEGPSNDPADRLAAGVSADSISLEVLTTDVPRDRSFVRLVAPDPIRFTMLELHELWREAIALLQNPTLGSKAGVRHLPVGPYRLMVVASMRGRSAGQVVIQGMPNHKQIELLTPTLRVASPRPTIAVWVYRDGSLVISYSDFRNVTKYVSWHAPTSNQDNYDDPADLNHTLLQFGLESPDQLSVALSKKFRPRNDSV